MLLFYERKGKASDAAAIGHFRFGDNNRLNFFFFEIRMFSKIDILSVDAPKVLG